MSSQSPAVRHQPKELTKTLDDGVITRLPFSSSRDPETNGHVQVRPTKDGRQIWQRLQHKAHFFACGDASRMNQDVDLALKALSSNSGHRTPMYNRQIERGRGVS